jgi:hypothetical protein
MKLPGSHPGSNVERLFSKRTVLIALLALGCSGVALAAQSKAQAPDPRALGMTEAVFDYCAKADPKGAAKVFARLKRLTQGASTETLAEVRKSDQYRKARSSVDDFVAKVNERNASRVCSGPLAAGKSRTVMQDRLDSGTRE